jgi:hypothetical protein
MKRLFVDESAQQPLVNTTMLLVDLGLALVLVLVALFLIWLLYDLLKKNGRWREDVAELDLDQPEETDVAMSQEVQA